MNSNNDDDDVSQFRLRIFDVVEEPRRMLPPIQGFETMPLVPLEEAVQPLIKHIHDIQHYAMVAKQGCKSPPPDGLSIDESASIRLYTMQLQTPDQHLYSILNKTLRDENRNLLKDWFLYLRLIITSLSKMSSVSRRLFRGVKLDLSKDYQKGDEIVWWAFSSCTDSIEVLEKSYFLGKTGIRTLFIIDCYSGKDIRDHSRYSNENEILLPPARKFQIVSSRDSDNGLHIVQLQEIKPAYLLLSEVPIADTSSSISADQVELMSFPVSPSPPKTTPPQPISLPLPIDMTYRNPDLERRISGYQLRSNMIFDGQRLTELDMKIVVDQAIIDRRCTKLSLHNTEIKYQGISTLALGIRESTTLKELNLSNNDLSDEDLVPLAQELSVNRTVTVEQWICCGIAKIKELDTAPIETLNLSHNNIGDPGAKHLAEVLKVKRTLIQLHLNDNRISDRGVQLLANALCNPRTSLEKLYLHNNRYISDQSADYLIDMFKQNRSLNTLWLTNCNLNNANKQKLKEAGASKKNFHLIVEPSDA